MRPNIDTIRARRAFIARQLDDLQNEDAELANVEAILTRLAKGGSLKERAAAGVKRRGRPPGRAAVKAATKGRAKANGAAKNGAAKKGGRGRKADAGSQRELVLQALKKGSPAWMNVRQIIATVKDTHGVSIPPRSLSPLLSNLKNSGAIVRNGRLVAAPERAKSR
jgi:hypothetical protein